MNNIEINQIVTREAEAVIEQISNSELVILAAKKAEIVYLQKNSNFNSQREVLAVFTNKGG